MSIYYGLKGALEASDRKYVPGDIIIVYEDGHEDDAKIKVVPRGNTPKTYAELYTISADIAVPSLQGSFKTESVLMAEPTDSLMHGDWAVVEDLDQSFSGQAGIAMYDASIDSWQITAIPIPDIESSVGIQDPNSSGIFVRKTTINADSSVDAEWTEFDSVDGNDITLTIRHMNSLTNPDDVPAKGEMVFDEAPDRQCVVLGNGVTTIKNLRPYYETTFGSSEVIDALGYTPEDSANKGQLNGYAPLVNGKVPDGYLPDSMVDVYSKSDVDSKINDAKSYADSKVNAEATLARSNESEISDSLSTHISDTTLHVTALDKTNWDNKLDSDTKIFEGISDKESPIILGIETHISEDSIHVTQAEKDAWNGMNRSFFVHSESELPITDVQIGNIGYVQKSADGVSPIVCDEYMYDGTSWKQRDVNQVSLQFNWSNLVDKPNSSPLMIDNSIAWSHQHLNRQVLDKIGQSDSGNFTFDGIEIGVRVKFVDTEFDLPEQGEPDVLYIVYSDTRVRQFPSISVWKQEGQDASYQILGRGVQDTAQAVGDMVILQAEFFNVAANSTHYISVTSNEQFTFLPLEVLKEVAGLKNQKKIITEFNDSTLYNYNDNLISIDETNKLTADIKDIQAEGYKVEGNYRWFKCAVDMSEYRDVNYIG